MKGRKSKSIGPQRAVRQRAVRRGRTTTAKGRKVLANQKRVQQKGVPALRHVGSYGGRDYYATAKKRRR